VISVGTISDRTTLRAQPADLQLAVICALTASMVREVACVRDASVKRVLTCPRWVLVVIS
jgi:hypothetical protein